MTQTYIAFKRASNCPAVKNSLHSDFIVEWADTSQFSKGFHKVEDGWEILPEEDFNGLFEQNNELHELNLQKKQDEWELKLKADIDAESAEFTEEKHRQQDYEEFKEDYEEFKQWKAIKDDPNKGEI